jgi:signal transduction histidine kinase
MEKAQSAWWRRKRPNRLTVRVLTGTAILILLTEIFATDVDDFLYPNDLWGRTLTDVGILFVVVLPTFYFALLRPLLRLMEEKSLSEESLRLRARELGAVNAVSEVAARELDTEQLLSRVMDVVLSLFEAEGGWVLLLGDGQETPLRILGARGLPPHLATTVSGDLCLDCPTSCWGILERLPPGEITLITECRDLPREVLLAAGFGGYVGVLLPVGRHVRAVLNLVWRAPRTLDEADQALVRAVARQIGIAAESAALYEAEQRARHTADTIASVGLTLNRTLDLDAVLQTLFDHMGRFVPYDRAKVMLLEGESRLAVRAVFSPSGSTETAGEGPASFDALQSPFVTDVLQTQRSLCVGDLHAHPSLVRRTEGEIERSWLGVPLVVAGRVIGLVTLVKAEPGFYTPEQVKLAEALAAPASVAIANARLFGEVVSGRKRLETISRKLVGVQEAERRHLARELHDEIGQSLTAIFYRLEAAQSAPKSSANRILEEAIEIADRTIKTVRDLSLDLRPSLLDEAGLGETLRWYIDRQVQSDSLDVGLSVSPNLADLSPEVRGACFRIVQEALTNVVRHAQARHARVNLQRSKTRIAVAVWDDGRGFDVDEACQRARTGHSLGILGMQERAELLGGELAFESRPGGGTTVRAWVPVPECL